MMMANEPPWLEELKLAIRERRLWLWSKGRSERKGEQWRYRRKCTLNDRIKINTIAKITDPGWADAMMVVAWSDPNLLIGATHFEIMMAEKTAQAKREK